MIVFFDTEVSLASKSIKDFGAVNLNGQQIHTSSIHEFTDFIKNAKYLVGHNIFNHDLKYLEKTIAKQEISYKGKIDTLLFSPLLFPLRPYHALVKDDKIESQSINNPLNDAINAQKLFFDEVNQFNRLDQDLKMIYYTLLSRAEEYRAFFKYINYYHYLSVVSIKIKQYFYGKICQNADLNILINTCPVELAYSLALINTNDVNSIFPPWVMINYPRCNHVLQVLREKKCEDNCQYCNDKLNSLNGLKRYFNYDQFRTFDGLPLQEEAVEAAIKQESILVVFPTGGGKSLTFQLPALMARDTSRGLTVVISPLQSLMKDQVDNLETKSIIEAVTINGLLDPIQRANAIERVRDGSAGILYIAPESLRSKTIERLLLGRNVIRIVIDEAHCFSSWGHDFRVDYLYIGTFIVELMKQKGLKDSIPISCFTATAKVDVIKDISKYFKEKLNLDLKVFQVGARRENLAYKVINVTKDDKYIKLRDLIEQENCPTIVYAATRKKVEEIAKRLKDDGVSVSYFHGGLGTKEKVEQQESFMQGSSQVMVATNAFGMGVDKKDIGAVIHHDISSSLENYIQEAGRAGRDLNIHANCYILYDEEDLNEHFTLLNYSKINHKEIQQIWRAIKELSKNRDNFTQSTLEIARTAGWSDEISDLHTRVITAISALEEAGYIVRGTNSPRIFATSLLVKDYVTAEKIIDQSGAFSIDEIINAKRIVKKLVSSKSKSKENNEAESRVDYISDQLGIPKEQVIRIIQIFRDIKILEDSKDLSTYLKASTKVTTPLKTLKNYLDLADYIISKIDQKNKHINIKLLNEEVRSKEIDIKVKNIIRLINYLSIIKIIVTKKENDDNLRISLIDNKGFDKKITLYFSLSEFIIEDIYRRLDEVSDQKELSRVTFSVVELKNLYSEKNMILGEKITLDDVEQALLLLEKLGIIHLEGGFMVLYSALKITRKVRDNKYLYTKTDYRMLENYYEGKTTQIHIVGEYAKKMVQNYRSALTFVDDYFTLEYSDFLAKYFNSSKRQMMKKNMTESRFKQLFGSLSPEQIAVINDKEHRLIAVAAGPGSGKTKLLVHKLASIIYTEDIRQEQLLMLTFSRAAAIEFKRRLVELIGTPGQYVEIKTFHSFAFDILGRLGSLDNSENVIHDAIELINNGEADPNKVTKMVVVIDEAQDMSEQEYELIQALINHNENLRLIAVGDDDQNIFEFRGSSSKHFRSFANEEGGFYELSTNYRSQRNIVHFANTFVEKIHHRLKQIPIKPFKKDLGNIRVVTYKNKNFINRIVNDLIKELPQGKTCILTRTNEDASTITGLLTKHKIDARLIQSNDDFRLMNLYEIRYFMELLEANITNNYISEDVWATTFAKFKNTFGMTRDFDMLSTILFRFYETAGKIIYKSDIVEYLNEINLSDFLNNERIVVSTFHKAKGKEFDNIIILFDNDSIRLSDAELRLLYVGITRAKNNLTIHTNSKYFSSFKVENITYEVDESDYIKPEQLVFQLSHKDIQLGYAKLVSRNVAHLKTGDDLEIEQFPILTKDSRKIMKFSNKYIEDNTKICDSGYVMTSALINHLVYWTDQGDMTESLLVLPEITYQADDLADKNAKTIISNEVENE